MKNNRAILLAGGAIVVAALAAYANTFHAPLLFDDEPSILYNPSIRQLWPLSEPLSPPKGFGMTVSGRPLLNLSLAINYAISGREVWSYHVMNLIIHACAGLALFGLARRTLQRPVLAPRFGDQALPVALAIALLWTLHPLQTESVTYIIQRAESLMGLFYLLTLYAFARAADAPRPVVWQVVTLVACTLGMLCKEVMVTAPLVVLLYDRSFVAGNFREAWRQRHGFYLALALTWAPLAWQVLQGGASRGGTFELTPAAFRDYWMTQFGAITCYLRLTFWPHPLIFDYGTFWVHGFSAVVWDAAVVYVLLGSSIWLLWRRPTAGFLAACFWLILAPSSLGPGRIQMIVEHRMYLSLAAVIALVVGFAASRLGRRAAWSGVALAVVAGGFTFHRNAVYASDYAIWSDTYQKRPSSLKAVSNLGTAYYRLGDYEKALALYQKSVEREPAPQTFFNLGLALEKLGRIDEAIPHYEEAVRKLPYFAHAHAMLGGALARKGKLPEAMDHLMTALHYSPEMAETHYQLGNVMAQQGRHREALGSFEEALRLQPNFAEPECGIGIELYRLGRLAEAQQHLEKALQLNPALADAHYNLGLVLMTLGKGPESMAHYAEAVRLAPGLAEARLNWGIALAQSGKSAEALTQLQEAVRLKPELAEAHGNLGIALAEAGRVDEAVPRYREALRLRPDYAMMHYNLGNALLQQRQWTEARSHFAEAVRLRPDYAPAKEMLDQLRALPANP